MEVSSASPSSSMESLLNSLTSKGWCFSDVEQVRAIVIVQTALTGPFSDVESELCNLDLRAVGGKSLPDASLLRKASLSLLPPKVLQIASVRDISRRSEVDDVRSSGNKRVLKMVLTDGQSEVTAIEFSHISSLSDDVVPGTKIRLEKRVVAHYGIICLTPDAITVLGGVVQSLYEEWQMNQKYAGFSRSSLRVGRNGETGGPPPFEKLQIESKQASAHNVIGNSENITSKPSKNIEIQQPRQLQASNARVGAEASTSQGAQEKQPSADTRPKEVTEYIPIQNQAASQKLLQKLNNPNYSHERRRAQRYRGKGEEEETQVFTLDEWERRKPGANFVARVESPDVSRVEDLA